MIKVILDATCGQADNQEEGESPQGLIQEVQKQVDEEE